MSTDRFEIGLDMLNSCAPETAGSYFSQCCGSAAWADRMARSRPFSSIAELEAVADRTWAACSREDWLEAFAAHPRIGERPREAWAQHEQAQASLAGPEAEAALIAGNREYEAKFGYIFIVCALGKSAEEMLAVLERRLHNNPDVEIQVAVEEQRQITRLRLRTLLGI